MADLNTSALYRHLAQQDIRDARYDFCRKNIEADYDNIAAEMLRAIDPAEAMDIILLALVARELIPNQAHELWPMISHCSFAASLKSAHGAVRAWLDDRTEDIM